MHNSEINLNTTTQQRTSAGAWRRSVPACSSASLRDLETITNGGMSLADQQGTKRLLGLECNRKSLDGNQYI
jgi:hypothetical protein